MEKGKQSLSHMANFTDTQWAFIAEMRDLLRKYGQDPKQWSFSYGEVSVEAADRDRLVEENRKLRKACQELLDDEPFGVTPYFDKALRKLKHLLAETEGEHDNR